MTAIGIFFLCLGLLGYVYFGYPLLVWLLGRRRRAPAGTAAIEPEITLVIAAHNEEEVISSNLINKLTLDYPRDRLEILVVADGCSDRTEELVAEFADRGVRLLRQSPRAGKTAALNLAVAQARGEILVFADANSLYDRAALRALVAHFADPRVGYVTGQMVYVDEQGSPVGAGCSAYMRYENFLRRWESQIGSVVGVDGGIDAVRRALYQPMRPDQLPDLVLPLRVVEQGYRVVYEPAALLFERTLEQGGDEYRMRVRVALRALWALYDLRRLLANPRNLLFSWQLWSHKVLRYLCFGFLVGLALSNLALWNAGSAFRITLLLQVAAGLAAALGWLAGRRGRRLGLGSLAYYFLLVNTAAGQAFVQFLRGEKKVLWTPRKG